MNKLMLIILSMIMLPKTNAIGQQIKHVVSNGGDIKYGATYTSFSVVGQLATSEFSTGTYSGSIGYLDISDNNPNTVSKLAPKDSKFNVYPNPSSGDVYVEYNADGVTEIILSVTDDIGKRIFLEKYSITNGRKILLSKEIFRIPGEYIITIKEENINSIQKLIIVK